MPSVYLGAGHPLPLWLAIVGVIDLILTPIGFVMYVREALGPHDTDTEPDTEPTPDERPAYMYATFDGIVCRAKVIGVDPVHGFLLTGRDWEPVPEMNS